MNTPARLEEIAARARADLAAARRAYDRRNGKRSGTGEGGDDGGTAAGRTGSAPETLPQLMVPVELDRVGPCSGRRRSSRPRRIN